MLIDLPLLVEAMLAMLVAATVIDFVSDRVVGRTGLAAARYADRLLVNLLFFALMPGALAQKIGAAATEITGERREVTVLFWRIAGLSDVNRALDSEATYLLTDQAVGAGRD